MGSGITAVLARRGLWMLLVPLLVAVIGAAAWFVASGRFSDEFGSDLERGIAEESASPPEGNAPRDAGGAGARRPSDAVPGEQADQSPVPADSTESASGVLDDVWSVARLVLLGLGLLAGAVIVARTIARRRRRYVRYLIKVGATDRAGPQDVASLFAALHAALARRAHERLLLGQPAVSFEIHNLVAGENHEQRLVLALPEEPELVESVRGELSARYPNVEVAPARANEPFWCEQIVRLKKRHPFAPRTLRIPAESEWESARTLMDALLKVMGAQGETATVQLILTPTPRLFESAARALIGAREETLERERTAGRSAGAGSQLASEELAGGTRGLAFEALFFGDIRIGARKRAVARRIGDAIVGNSRDRNQLAERLVHSSPRRGLLEARMRRNKPNLVPSWWRNVFSAAELAGLWQLPSIGAHGGALRRHTQPRLEAAPPVRRVSETLALASDARGGVALWPEDYFLHHLILGVQGSGKTSLLLREFEVMARDYTRAVILLDPKQDAARRALGLVPTDRPVTFLSLRHPEVGLELWDLPGASPSEVMDAMIWALTELTRTEGGEPQLYASSERFLRYAGIMVQAAYARPTFFHLRHLLSVSKAAIAERERIASLYGDDENYAAACEHLLEWNEQLKRAGSQQTIRMDAPSNKVAQLTDPLVDRVLRHPRPIDLDRIIREREVLILEGNIQLGQEMTRTLNLLLLGRIHRALLAQHELPEERRVRTHLLLDEAHVHFSQLLAEMAEVDRAAGLEITAAGQHLAQMRDRYVHKALLSLFAHKSIHRVGLEDARLLTDSFQLAWSDSLRASESDTTAMPVSPATLSKQPVHQFTGGWTARGEAQPPFTATTFAQRGDVTLAEYHLEEQRSRFDAFEPEKPPPIPAIGVEREEGMVRDDGTQPNVEAEEEPVEAPEVRAGGVAARASASAGAGTATIAPRRAREPDAPRGQARAVQVPKRSGDGARPGAGTRPPVRSGDSAGGDGATPAAGEHGIGESAVVSELGSPTTAEISDYYRELARYSGARIHGFRAPEPEPNDPRRPRLDRVDHEIVRAVWTFRGLSGPMIRRRYMPDVSERAARERMLKLVKSGLVKRCLITTRGSGADPHIYVPTRRGFELLRKSSHREVRIPSGALYRERELTDHRYLVHDLHVGAWILAFQELAPEAIKSVEGPLLSRIEVPKVFDRDERRHRNVTLAEITGIGPSGDLVKGLRARPDQWGPVKPDVSVHVEVRGRPFDLLIEYEHRSNPNSVKDKLRNYDSLLTATWRELARYAEWGYPPIAIFVCSTPERAVELAKVADREVTGRAIERLEDPDGRATTRTRRPGRSRIFFCAEQDVHQRTTRAIRLVQQTADERRAAARNRAEAASAGDRVELRPFLGREALTRPAM